LKSTILPAVGIVLLIAATLIFGERFAWFHVRLLVHEMARWTGILLLVGYAAKKRSQTVWILVGMALGVEFGHEWPATAVQLQVLGAVFLRLIKLIIAPLVFSTLVVGIAGHPNLKKVSRMGVKTLIYFEVVSTLALFIGFVAINLSRAGEGIQLPPSAANQAFNPAARTPSEFILNIFPENIAKSVYEGEVLQIVIFSVLFGFALATVPEAKRRPMLHITESLAETMFKLTNLVMLFAPIGVFGAIAYTVGHSGLGVMTHLVRLLMTMYVGLAVFIVLVFLPIAFVARVPIVRFLKAVAEPVTIAFATASSEAALPRAMEEMEWLGVPRETVAFVLPVGYSFNLDDSCLYQSLALIFIAQASGVHLTFSQQAMMLATLLVSSKGVAGVARASLVIVLGTATSFGLPLEPFFLLFGIDQLMDMARTAVNVLGNCLATVVVARLEGEVNAYLR
jgi:proton glutamate symport protein